MAQNHAPIAGGRLNQILWLRNFIRFAMITAISLGLVLLTIVRDIPAAEQSPASAASSQVLTAQAPSHISRTGNIEYTHVVLDGQPLFQVTALTNPDASEAVSPALKRSQTIENTLNRLLNTGFNPKTLTLKVAQLNHQTVIVADDGHRLSQVIILTITELDTQIAQQSVSDLAQAWIDILQANLIQAWDARQPEARRQQRLTAIQIFLGMLAISTIVALLQRWFRVRFRKLQKLAAAAPTSPVFEPSLSELESAPAADPKPTSSGIGRYFNRRQQLDINILIRRLLWSVQLFIWLGGIAWILMLAPETRIWGRQLLSLPLKILAIVVTVSAANKITHLLINQNIQGWVEVKSITAESAQRIELRAPTIAEVAKGIANFSTWVIGFTWFLAWQQAPLSSALTGAGLLGVALGLMFQNLVSDWVNGILIVLGDQYAVGDVVDLGVASGFVEAINLRATQLRGDGGRLSSVPHRQIGAVHNLTKDWARVDFKIVVAYDADVTLAMELMQQVAETMQQDPVWWQTILEPKLLLGVSQVDNVGVELLMWIKTQRLKQWEVEREFRRRLKVSFDQHGIQIGAPRQTLSIEKPTDLSDPERQYEPFPKPFS